MGVIYKLKPEIRDYIIKIQAEKPSFGCRKLAVLLSDKFQIKVSKSSINSVIKHAGLSMPVGRRHKSRRSFKDQEIEGTGEILLKAVDLLVGGEVYLADLEKEARCIKVDLSDGGSFYLDGQFRTVWSTPNIPYSFSTTIYAADSYVKRHLLGNLPVALFTAPGYDIPTQEFFDFLIGLDSGEKTIAKLTLYTNKLEEIKNYPIKNSQRRFFVFGLWPWQFNKYRKVNSIGEFKPVSLEASQKDLYLASIEIELLQPKVNKRVILKGCALKTSLTGKINIVILSNLTAKQVTLECLANLYLSNWPNLEEGFQDFSRKIEFFTYAANDQYSFSLQHLELDKESPIDIQQAPGLYLKALDYYLRWHFFPSGYEKKDYPVMLNNFYQLTTKVKNKKNYRNITFQLPAAYSFSKDLEYACHRLNEREIITEDNRLIRFNI